MLCYDRIDTCEGINVNKTNASKKCNICYYWYCLDKGLSFEPCVSNGCHDVLMTSMNLRDIAILEIFGFDYAALSTKLA